MRHLIAVLCALLLFGCTEPRVVIVKTVVVEKRVPVGREKGEKAVRQCPQNKEAWADYCKAVENETDCNRKNYCYWQGGKNNRCVRIPHCKDKGLNYPQ
jgi:hypothetical protein